MPPKRKLKERESAPATKKPRKTKAKKKTAGADGKKRTSFLSLPAELRNDVYGMALIDEYRIKVHRRLREPALLRTCRQIRAEARKVWFLNNKFETRISNCDARVAVAFDKLIQESGVEVDSEGRPAYQVPIEYTFTGVKDWDGIMSWCKEMHKHGMTGLYPAEKDCKIVSIIAAAHSIVRVSLVAGGTWKTCREALMAFRAAADKLNSRWAWV